MRKGQQLRNIGSSDQFRPPHTTRP